MVLTSQQNTDLPKSCHVLAMLAQKNIFILPVDPHMVIMFEYCAEKYRVAEQQDYFKFLNPFPTSKNGFQTHVGYNSYKQKSNINYFGDKDLICICLQS